MEIGIICFFIGVGLIFSSIVYSMIKVSKEDKK